MTYAEKKIEEFKNFNEECLCLLPDQKDDIINWLRKALSEAEREGYKKAIDDFDLEYGTNKIIKAYCEKKLAELEQK